MSSVGDVARGLPLAPGFCFHFVRKLGWAFLATDSSLRLFSVSEVSLCLEGGPAIGGPQNVLGGRDHSHLTNKTQIREEHTAGQQQSWDCPPPLAPDYSAFSQETWPHSGQELVLEPSLVQVWWFLRISALLATS